MKRKRGKSYLGRKMKEYYILLVNEKLAPGSTLSLYSVLLQHLRITPEALTKHYSQNSSILAFWMGKYRQECYKLRLLERDFETKYSAEYLLAKSRSKLRTSESELKLRLTRSNQLSEMQKKIDAQRYRVDLLKDLVEVMRVRNENVISLGANVRTEKRGSTDSSGRKG